MSIIKKIITKPKLHGNTQTKQNDLYFIEKDAGPVLNATC